MSLFMVVAHPSLYGGNPAETRERAAAAAAVPARVASRSKPRRGRVHLVFVRKCDSQRATVYTSTVVMLVDGAVRCMTLGCRQLG